MATRAAGILMSAVVSCMVWFAGVGEAHSSPPPTFANPPQSARPGVWVGAAAAATPGPAVDALAQAGFGAAQLDVDVSDPSAAQATVAAALSNGRHDDLGIDPNVAGHQAFASPALTDADSMQELVPANVAVSGPTSYSARPPFPGGLVGTPTLVAVTAARVSGQSGTTTLLDPSSAVDLTSDVNSSGVLNWRVPAGNWELFGFWERATGQTASQIPFEPPSAWSARVPTTSPGSYFLADIFSGAGARAAVDYAGSDLFGTANLQGLRASGASLFGDSLEVQAEMFWTSDLPAQFQRRRGYSVIKYLPALHNVEDSSFDPLDPTQTGPVPPPQFDFAGGVGQRVRYDYDRTLTDLYVDEYLGTLTRRANALGLQSRDQVAYNYLPLNVTRAAEAVDIPETETFDFGWPQAFVNTLPSYPTSRWRYRIDAFRETAAGAHIAHRDRVTAEWGDDFAIYQKQPLQYADEINDAVAGGVTQGYLAGFVGVANTPWPVPTGLAVIGDGENWSTNWPQWGDWPALNGYLARTTEVVESGSPRMDVAVYNDDGLSNIHDSSPVWASPTLGDAGYTYEFVDPVSLASRQADTIPGELFGTGPAYRALVINNQATMPVDTARAILRMARQGLHVVLVGPAPSASPGLLDATAQDATIQTTMQALLSLSDVAQVASEDAVPAALGQLNVAPAAAFPGAGALMTVHRTSNGRDTWWIYNPSNSAVSATASFDAIGQPYQLDLWNGTTTALAQFSAQGRRTSVPLTLAAHATTAVVFTRGSRAHVTATSAQAVEYGPRGSILLRDTRGGIQSATLSNGRRVTAAMGAVPAPVDVADWHLHVEAISPTGTTSHDVDLNGLQDWRTIPGLQSAVGTGTYTATVIVPTSWLGARRAVLIDVGDVEGAMRLQINGQLVTNQTTSNAERSGTALLHPGRNTITVRLDTTLLNQMVALKNEGLPAYQTGPTPLDSAPTGLLGPVQLIPASLAVVQP